MTTIPTYLTQDELKRFFAVITSPRDKALFGLIYHDGLRVGEALMLTVDDVNFRNHRITVRRLKHGLSGEKLQWIGDQAPFVRPDNSQMAHRRPAECGLSLTCKVNEPTMVYEPKLFPVNLPVI